MKHDRPHQRLALRQEPRPPADYAGEVADPTPIQITFNAANSDIPVTGIIVSIYDELDNLLAVEPVSNVEPGETFIYTTSYQRAWTSFTVNRNYNGTPTLSQHTTQPLTLNFTHDGNEDADYLGDSLDKVGQWGDFDGNGVADVQFRFNNSINLTIKSITITIDERPGWAWSSVSSYLYPVGISTNGGSSLVNSAYSDDLALSCYLQNVDVFCCTVSTGGSYSGGLTWRIAVTYSDDTVKTYTAVN